MPANHDGLPPSLAPFAAVLTHSGCLSDDVRHFLVFHGCEDTADHCANVVEVAVRLARRHGTDPSAAHTAAWLHDVSAVIPVRQRLEVAQVLRLPVLPEEAAVPMILHQKLSAVIAGRLFNVHDATVLAAIRYHTTLHPCAGLLAKVVFIADKLAWDQPGRPPYEAALLSALDRSPDAAVCVYLNTLWAQRATLPVVHPWLAAARDRFCVASGGQ